MNAARVARTARRAADPDTLRAALWTLRSLARARRRLRTGGLDDLTVAPPPQLPPGAVRGVTAVLRRLDPSCLERSLVLQRWLAAHGDRRDVVIGVTAPRAGFRAHAWLDGEPADGERSFDELLRLSP